MSSSRRMDHMTWPEIEASKSKPVIVPIGSTEQHSQHLPLGVDAMIASHVSEDLAERIDGIVAPTMNYGYKSKPLSGGGPLFPGTIDMNGVTVINQMHDVLGELIADGFTKIVVMNAHFENEAFIIEAIDLITRETKGVATIVETNWWDPLPENVVEQVFDGLVFPGWALEHAAVTETSLMMHYEPELVHMDRVIDEAMSHRRLTCATRCARATFRITEDWPLLQVPAPNEVSSSSMPALMRWPIFVLPNSANDS